MVGSNSLSGETIECSSQSSVFSLGIMTVLALAVGVAFCLFSYFDEGHLYHPFGIICLIAFIFCFYGYLCARARWNKFGLSRLRLPSPAVLGKELRCTLTITGDIQPTGDFKFTLICKERTIKKSGNKRTSRTDTKWKQEKIISPVGKSARAGITVAFTISTTALASGSHGEGRSVFWEVDVDAPTSGVNYFASFPLHVWESQESMEKEAELLAEEDEAEDREQNSSHIYS